jgi:hypothetical protein
MTKRDAAWSRRLSRRRRTASFAVVLAGLIGAGFAASPAVADNVLRTNEVCEHPAATCHELDSGPGLHWRDWDAGGFPRGFMYWIDYTPAPWPVFASAIEFDRAPGIDAVYLPASRRDECVRHCVAVRAPDLGASCRSFPGRAFVPHRSNGHLRERTRVEVNERCERADGVSRADRRELVCHEMGHTIGLDATPPQRHTCMREGFMVGERFPNDHDYRMLARLYDHND